MDALKTKSMYSMEVKVYGDKTQLGKASAEFAAAKICDAIDKYDIARVIFATGASQFEFLEALIGEEVDWSKVHAFHLDEYVNLPITHPASFRKYLKERLFDKVNPAAVHYLDADADDMDAECKRYQDLLVEGNIHLACIGIGENGHIAFNDPPVADFNDPVMVKLVELDEDCRKQQLGEGWFPTLKDVPTHALTQTVPSIMRSQCISCVVPDERKAQAVYNALEGPVETRCPASVLRTHQNITLWLDEPAASKLEF